MKPYYEDPLIGPKDWLWHVMDACLAIFLLGMMAANSYCIYFTLTHHCR